MAFLQELPVKGYYNIVLMQPVFLCLSHESMQHHHGKKKERNSSPLNETSDIKLLSTTDKPKTYEVI